MSKLSFRFPVSIFIAVFFLISCGDKVNRPDELIEKDKFAKVLADIHLVEANYMKGREVPDSLKERYLEKYNLVFEIHEVDSETFFENFEYYRKHPKHLEDIYEQVHTRLQLQQEELIHQNAGENQDKK